jgi:hypothetical protein
MLYIARTLVVASFIATLLFHVYAAPLPAPPATPSRPNPPQRHHPYHHPPNPSQAVAKEEPKLVNSNHPDHADIVKQLNKKQQEGEIGRSQAINANPKTSSAQSYKGTIPPLQTTGNTHSHMQAYAEFASAKIAKEHDLTPHEKSELVVSAHHFDKHDSVYYRTQPRGADTYRSGEKAKEHFPELTKTVMTEHGPLKQRPDLPWIHSEVAGTIEVAQSVGATEGNMREKMPGHVIGIYQSPKPNGGKGWDRPCGNCHEVLATHTAADYKGRDVKLKDESRRVVPRSG